MRPFTRSTVTLAVAALVLLGALGLAGGATAATLAATTTCANGVDNTGGLGLICEVTVVNTITASGGSATVTVRECHGAAGAPAAACTVQTKSLTTPVTAVTQCNDSINGGGGTLRCSVRVTNVFDGVAPGSSAATVNQCVGSGDGITVGCNPFPATTSGATITQCNGSANGGTLVGLTCTASGTRSSAQVVRINQCNGSANGGGALVICSASITDRVVTATPSAATPVPTRTPRPTVGRTARPTVGGTARSTPPPTDTAVSPRAFGPTVGPALALLGLISLAGVVVGRTRRRSAMVSRKD